MTLFYEKMVKIPSIEQITDILNDRKKAYQLKKYDQSFKEFIRRNAETIYMIFTTSDKFEDILLSQRKKYNLNYEIFQPSIDLGIYNMKYNAIFFGYPSEQIRSRIEDYNALEERMLFRSELYRTGWKIVVIEKYINKLFYHKNNSDSINSINTIIKNIDRLEYQYYNIFIKNGIQPQCMTVRSKGRPEIPLVLKPLIKKYQNDNRKNLMREKYERSKEMRAISQEMLSIPEYECISNALDLYSLQNKSVLDQITRIKDKCKHFTLKVSE